MRPGAGLQQGSQAQLLMGPALSQHMADIHRGSCSRPGSSANTSCPRRTPPHTLCEMGRQKSPKGEGTPRS